MTCGEAMIQTVFLQVVVLPFNRRKTLELKRNRDVNREKEWSLKNYGKLRKEKGSFYVFFFGSVKDPAMETFLTFFNFLCALGPNVIVHFVLFSGKRKKMKL